MPDPLPTLDEAYAVFDAHEWNDEHTPTLIVVDGRFVPVGHIVPEEE